jgi:hypothetical protein
VSPTRRLHPGARRSFGAGTALSLLVALGVGCGGDDTAEGPGPVDPTDAGPAVVSRLVAEGEHVCEGEEGNVTVSARVVAPPPVDMSHIDLVSARATLDDDYLGASFTVAGAPIPDGDATYLLFLGFLDDPRGFEVRVAAVEGVWAAEVVERAGTINRPRPLRSAVVETEDDTISVRVDRTEVPAVAPNLPVNFGTSAVLRDEQGDLIDSRGELLADGADPVSAIDECIAFGQ